MMLSDHDSEIIGKYLENRAKYPAAKLQAYRGRFIAWAPDGSRIVASSEDASKLDDLIRAVGEDVEACVVEGIPASDCVIGGMDIT